MPGQPKNLQVIGASPNHIEIRWRSPEKDGGTSISGYNVEKKDINRPDFLFVANVNPTVRNYKVTRLFENTDYLFRVFAENKVGVGEPITLDEPVTAKLPFSESSRFRFIYSCWNKI